VIGGSFCGGTVQGTYSQKMGGCMKCEFYSLVRQEEGPNYKGSREIIKLLDDKNKSA